MEGVSSARHFIAGEHPHVVGRPGLGPGAGYNYKSIIEQLYQLGIGEEESFRHARQGVPYPGQGGTKKGEAVGGRIQPTRPNPLPLPVTG